MKTMKIDDPAFVEADELCHDCVSSSTENSCATRKSWRRSRSAGRTRPWSSQLGARVCGASPCHHFPSSCTARLSQDAVAAGLFMWLAGVPSRESRIRRLPGWACSLDAAAAGQVQAALWSCVCLVPWNHGFLHQLACTSLPQQTWQRGHHHSDHAAAALSAYCMGTSSLGLRASWSKSSAILLTHDRTGHSFLAQLLQHVLCEPPKPSPQYGELLSASSSRCRRICRRRASRCPCRPGWSG